MEQAPKLPDKQDLISNSTASRRRPRLADLALGGAVAVVLSALIALGVTFFVLWYSDEEKPSLPPHLASSHDDFKYFQSAGDIGKITVQSLAGHRSASISLAKGTTVERTDNGSFIVLKTPKDEYVTVDLRELRITVYANRHDAPITVDVGNGSHEAGTVHSGKSSQQIIVRRQAARVTVECTVANVSIANAQDDATPLVLTRTGPRNETITVESVAGTTIFEHRHSGEIKLLFSNSSDIPQQDDQQQRQQQQPLQWEHMLILPQLLNVSAVNSEGAIDFQDGETRLKFGDYSLGNESVEVRFPDKYGEIRMRNGRGDAVWLRTTAESGGLRSAVGAKLSVECRRVVEATDASGERQLRVDLLAKTVGGANESSHAIKCDAARAWSAPAASVRIEGDCDRAANTTPLSASAARVGELSLWPTPTTKFEMRSADGAALLHVHTSADYSPRLDSIVGWLGLRNWSVTTYAVFRPHERVYFYTGAFEPDALPGKVAFNESRAIITGHAATITIAPFVIA